MAHMLDTLASRPPCAAAWMSDLPPSVDGPEPFDPPAGALSGPDNDEAATSDPRAASEADL